ncbi:hypothetical protein ACQEU8_21520 [Streptomyces sp. CA-250714]|uniref:hypothetical protein n=1 Tax=Streptomyces sp. CA-250714 TaxID=3240060 RepID=UPI003D935D61
MTAVTRLVTHVEMSGTGTDARSLSVSARLEAVLADGRSETLLDDRGWSSMLHGGGVDEQQAGIRAWISVEDVEETARMVVGPDEPVDGESYEDAATAHWTHLADTLARQGVHADARELERLPHDVVLGERLWAWIADEP